MFAVQCSFCQHENTPGARFCAECGSPLHLRVCPNPKCGKVSDVNVAQCEFCGTPFPKIPLAEAGGGTATPPSSGSDDGESLNEGKSAAAPKASISAWPLIAVAIVAGGLPLLWFNRASLPTPKTWQNSPEVERLIAPLPPSATLHPPPQNPTATPSSQAPAQSSEALALPPLSTPIQPPPTAEKALAATTAPLDAPASSKASDTRPSAQEKSKAKQESSDKKPSRNAGGANPDVSQASRPCTEAAAALGLCEAKQAVK